MPRRISSLSSRRCSACCHRASPRAGPAPCRRPNGGRLPVSSKPGRPVLQPPELGSSPPLPRVPRPGPDDPRFRVAEALERPEALRDAVATGRVRAINADTADGIFGREAGADAARSRRTAPEVALSTKVPDYVLKQLRL